MASTRAAPRRALAYDALSKSKANIDGGRRYWLTTAVPIFRRQDIAAAKCEPFSSSRAGALRQDPWNDRAGSLNIRSTYAPKTYSGAGPEERRTTKVGVVT
jgi:hypothetical protein